MPPPARPAKHHDGRDTVEGMAYVISLAVGIGVGILYGLIRVKSPAPPLVALVGLLGMVIGESAIQMLIRNDAKP